MKTSWGKPESVIAFIRTLMMVLSVAVCTVAADDLETVRKKAKAGDADAQNMLGVMYGSGKGVRRDDAEAMKWWRKAAEQGLAQAQFSLGWCYHYGKGVAQDDTEAVKWYRKAAEQGNANAQFNLGWMYDQGKRVPKDDVTAYAWLSVAAASGDEEARKFRESVKGRLTPSQLDRGQAMAREIFERIKKRKAAEEAE